MRGFAFSIILATCAAASAGTTVYTWVDAQGVTHYSDQPHQGATKMRVQDAPTYSAPPAASAPEAGTPSGRPPKLDCAIESPSDQQMIMNAWSVSGHIRLPEVAPGDRVVLMLDGMVLPGAADLSGNFNIPQVDRGQHTLAAQVLGPDGQVICEAPSVTFFVHQPNLNSPASPPQPQPNRSRF
jgi:hypothetical protein